MNDEVRTALAKYIEDQAKTAQVNLDPARFGQLVLRLGETLNSEIVKGLRPEVLASCDKFTCPKQFGCDWF